MKALLKNQPESTRADGARRLAGRSVIVSVLLVVMFVLTTCGSPWDLFLIVKQLEILAAYDGALVKFYGADFDEEFVDVVEYQSEYYVLGRTNSVGAAEFKPFLLRLSQEGFVLGRLLLEGPMDDTIEPVALASDADGNLIGVANVWDNTSWDIVVFRVDAATMNIEWQRRLNTPGDDEEAAGIFVDGNNYVVVGSRNDNEPLVFRVDHTDDTYAAYSLSGIGIGRFTSAVLLDDGNYLCVGETNLAGSLDALIVQVSSFDLSVTRVESIDFGDADESLGEVFIADDRTLVFGGYVENGVPENSYDSAWWVWTADQSLTTIRSVYLWANDYAPYAGVATIARAGVPYPIDHFVVGGETFQSVLMNTAGEIVWSVVRDENGRLNGEGRAIVPIDDGILGHLFVGFNSWRPSTDEHPQSDWPEAVALWCLPGDGTSYPGTRYGEVDTADTPAVNPVTLTPMPDNYTAAALGDYLFTPSSDFVFVTTWLYD